MEGDSGLGDALQPAPVLKLQESYKFFNCQTCVANERPERALREFLVIWNRKPPVGGPDVPEDDVTSMLFIDFISCFAQTLMASVPDTTGSFISR